MMDTITKPRTSRWRDGVTIFEERRTNAWAAELTALSLHGLSADAVAAHLGDGTTPDTVRRMWKLWRLHDLGLDTSRTRLEIPYKRRERAMLQFRGQDHGISAVEWVRRLSLVVAQDRNAFARIVHQDQFDNA